ncbi:hypothetical protein ES703_37338 [subsurface metagenome]
MEIVLKTEKIRKNCKKMKKERGLKRIYRYLGIGFSNILYKISKKINPNVITLCGFFVFSLAWLQYLGIYLFGEVNLINKILLIVGFNIALIIDYLDGEYARKTNKCSKIGHHLDGILDYIKISTTYLLLYLTTNEHFGKLLIFVSSVIFTIFIWSKYISYRENLMSKAPKEGKFLSLSLLFSFSITHQYLYFSIYLLFGLWQILVLQIALGSVFTFKNFVKLFKMAKIIDRSE